MKQCSFFEPNWISASEKLPKPGARVLSIHDHGKGPYMEVGSVVNGCCGDKQNSHYGEVDAGLLYWAEQPPAPINVKENAY